MENYSRRAEDKGQESLHVMMARIDERTKNTDINLEKHVENFEGHVEDDKKGFNFINKTLYVGLGILACLEFLFRK